MKINNKVLVETIGVLTVAASLIFVGLQLMLERRVATAEQYFNRTESAKEDRRTFLLSPLYFQEIEAWWATGERPPYWNEDWRLAKQLNKGEYTVATIHHRVLELQLSILGYDNIYFQYRQELIDENTWKHFRSQIKKAMIADPELTSAIYLNNARPTLLPVIQAIRNEIDAQL